ncbi:MAG: hypothetical protein KGR16_08320 [Verrucomicrobia bacterium]|nr:hypothetical protein [Verrucomicrobiota bacterium]MDE3048124.1 hypothetical protein [Verrucomicrobiota bacterium]
MRFFTYQCAVLVATAALHASPVGNTAAPKIIQIGFFTSCDSWVDFRAGYEGDFVADGKMKQSNQGQGRVDNYEQWTNSGTLTFNLLDRIDLVGVFGSSHTEADWRFEDAVAGTVTRIKVETETNFLWAFEGRAIVYEGCNTSIGLGGRYTSCNFQPNRLSSNGSIVSPEGSQFEWREWQINMDLSYSVHFFTPYIGCKYSHAETLLSHFATPISSSLTGSNSFKNRVPVGMYVGCAISNGHYFMFNLEGRVIDEEAVTVSAEFRF